MTVIRLQFDGWDCFNLKHSFQFQPFDLRWTTELENCVLLLQHQNQVRSLSMSSSAFGHLVRCHFWLFWDSSTNGIKVFVRLDGGAGVEFVWIRLLIWLTMERLLKFKCEYITSRINYKWSKCWIYVKMSSYM